MRSHKHVWGDIKNPQTGGSGAPAGGLTGESLVKASNTDYDVEWSLIVGEKGDTGDAGADGIDGDGWTGGSYNDTDGTVTFTSDDGLGFQTTDLRGADGVSGSEVTTMCVLSKSASAIQELNVGNGNVVWWTWDGEVKKDSGFTHSNTTNSSRVSVSITGWYEIIFSGCGQNTGNDRISLQGVHRVNGGTTLRNGGLINYSRGAVYNNLSPSLHTIVALTAGDYIEVGSRVDDADNVGSVETSDSELTDESHVFILKKVSSGTSEAYTQANILGTVGLSGGVPTGAIIESGSNANGDYTMWADGTMICKQTFTTGTSWAAWSPLYVSSSLTWTYPGTFIAAPTVIGIPASGAQAPYAWVVTGTGGVFTATCSLSVMKTTVTAGAVVYHVAAIGRWA